MKVDGTVAKNIAIHFLDRTTDRYTPSIVAKTVIQAKSLLKSGYTEEEIKSVIDHIVDNTSVNMYSLGYVSSAINNVLKEIKEEESKEIAKEQREEFSKIAKKLLKEGEVNFESKERNEGKLDRFGTKSRFGEEPYSDLFK